MDSTGSQTAQNGEPTVRPSLADAGRPCELINVGGWGNGDVFRASVQGQEAIIKTYEFKSVWKRWIGRVLIARELKAYRALRNVPGIPGVLDQSATEAFAIEYVDAIKISYAVGRVDGDLLVNRLRQLLAEIHSRGVFHLDLRNRGNVLVTSDGEPVLVDFASALVIQKPRPWNRWLAFLGRRFDAYGFQKWRERFAAP